MQLAINKTKKITLIIIGILSLALIITGIIVGLEPSEEESQNPGDSNTIQYLSLDSKFSVTTNTSYYKVKFKPTTTGYYNIYVDDTDLYEISDKSLPSPSTSVYNNGTYYDYCYKVYLYADTTYTITTDTYSNEYISILVKRY